MLHKHVLEIEGRIININLLLKVKRFSCDTNFSPLKDPNGSIIFSLEKTHSSNFSAQLDEAKILHMGKPLISNLYFPFKKSILHLYFFMVTPNKSNGPFGREGTKK